MLAVVLGGCGRRVHVALRVLRPPRSATWRSAAPRPRGDAMRGLAALRRRPGAAVQGAEPVAAALRRSACVVRASNLRTEREERAQLAGAGLADLPRGEMLELIPADGTASASAGWPAADEPALAHPGLRGAARSAVAAGHRLAVDTSLNFDASADGSRAAAAARPELTTDMLRIGGYFNEARGCVGLAVDSRWHELVHEMTHLAFHSTCAARDDGPPSPLRTHWASLRARGLSAHGAEEVVCREHELHALRASGAPLSTRLVIYDNMLHDAISDLRMTAIDDRSPAQRRELRRLSAVRTYATSPGARAAHAILAAALALAAAAGAASSCAG